MVSERASAQELIEMDVKNAFTPPRLGDFPKKISIVLAIIMIAIMILLETLQVIPNALAAGAIYKDLPQGAPRQGIVVESTSKFWEIQPELETTSSHIKQARVDIGDIHGIAYYYAGTPGGVEGTNGVVIPDEYSLRWRGIGTDEDGDSVDIVLRVHNIHTFGAENQLFTLLYEDGRIEADGSGMNTGLDQFTYASGWMDFEYSFYKSDSGEIANGSWVLQFTDIDIYRDDAGWSETVMLRDKYNSDIHIIPDDMKLPNRGQDVGGCWLNISGLSGNPKFEASEIGYDNDTLHTGFCVAAQNGFRFSWWGRNCGTIINNVYGQNIIAANAGDGGQISDPGNNEVPWKHDKTYTITPDKYYKIASVLVDGASVPITDPTGMQYTFAEVTEDHTISAAFERKKQTLSYEANISPYAGNTPSTTHDAGSNAIVSENGFIPPNAEQCIFEGWNTKPDGSGEPYSPGDTIFVEDEDIVLYAQWGGIGLAVEKKLESVTDDTGNTLHNVRKLFMSASGATYTQSKHLVLVMDRTGSLTQPVYDAIAAAFKQVSKDMMNTGSVKVSCILYSGENTDVTSQYWDGYHIPFIDSKDPDDLKHLDVPVSTTVSGWVDGINYGTELGYTSWHSGFVGLDEVLAQITKNDELPIDIAFFSDGDPSAHLNSAGKCVLTGSRESAFQYGAMQLKQTLATYGNRISSFTNIGLDAAGGDLTTMSRLTSEVISPAANASGFASVFIQKTTAQDVADKLTETIMNSLVVGYAKAVTIEDELSDNVVPTKLDTKGRPQITVALDKEDGNTSLMLVEDADYTYSYNSQSNNIKVEYLHDLPQGMNITASLLLRPSDLAIQRELAGTGEKDTGASDTGAISAGMQGWKTNVGENDVVSATNAWNMAVVSKLPTPVIQVEVSRVTYNKNAADATGEMESQSGEISSSVNASDNEFVRKDYTFLGWSEDPDAETPDVMPGDAIILDREEITLHAIWSKNPVLSVTVTGVGTATALERVVDGDRRRGSRPFLRNVLVRRHAL